MIDSELCNSKNYKRGIVDFDFKEFSRKFKKIKKEKRITQADLLSDIAEEIGFSKSTIKRWLYGKLKPQEWDDIVRLSKVLETSPECFMKSSYQDKIYEKYMEAREVANSNVVSDTDEYCDYLKSLCDFFDLIDEYSINININFERVEEAIKKLYEYSKQRRDERIQSEKEEERKKMEEKLNAEKEMRMKVERKYQDNFDKYAFLGKGKIKFTYLFPCYFSFICSVILLGSPYDKFNVGFFVVVLILTLILMIFRLFFRIKVKNEYYENYEKKDNDFMIFFLFIPTMTLLLIFTDLFNNNSLVYLNPIINAAFVSVSVLEEIGFLKNIEYITAKQK